MIETVAIKNATASGEIPNRVSEHLRDAILAGRLEAGLQLRQAELAKRFGTSRIPVREALRQLEAEGLVTVVPNRGATVRVFSPADIIELMEIRIALECHALKLAVPNMIEDDFSEAERILSDYDTSQDPGKWSEMNWRFHCALYTPCHQMRLLRMIEINYGHAKRFLRSKISRATGKEAPQRDHWRMLELCQQGKTNEVVTLLEHHIARTQKSLSASVFSSQRSKAGFA